jgi:hypothetical protein
MPQDVLSQQIAAPVEVTIAGRACRLSYPMHAVILYRAETARIERSRPQPADPDPRCVCGAPRSTHKGASLIWLGEADKLLCSGFRKEDPLQGDSLFLAESWLRIDLNSDPERWLACLWCGMHELQADGETWKAPFTRVELEYSIGLCQETRQISDKMIEAMTAWMPKAKAPDPNAAAPEARKAPAPITIAEVEPIPSTTSFCSGRDPVEDFPLPANYS